MGGCFLRTEKVIPVGGEVYINLWLPGLRTLPDAGWDEIGRFALTFNGYKHWGPFEKCAKVAKAKPHDTLTGFRTCLFSEQRGWRYRGPGRTRGPWLTRASSWQGLGRKCGAVSWIERASNPALRLSRRAAPPNVRSRAAQKRAFLF